MLVYQIFQRPNVEVSKQMRNLSQVMYYFSEDVSAVKYAATIVAANVNERVSLEKNLLPQDALTLVEGLQFKFYHVVDKGSQLFIHVDETIIGAEKWLNFIASIEGLVDVLPILKYVPSMERKF